MPIKGIIIILLSAVVFGVAYSREIYATVSRYFKDNNTNDKENKE